MNVIYQDNRVVVCIKPPGVRSTDEPEGLPQLVRDALGEPDGNIRTVHRLDQAVGGLMVLARTRRAASDLSQQMMEGSFHKEYLAVLHGAPQEPSGTFTDLLWRDKAERKTYVVQELGKDVREAVLEYEVLAKAEAASLVHIVLRTGRTHQIRAQFSSHGLPLWGDRKYGAPEADICSVALWSYRLGFTHPATGEALAFCQRPPEEYPWTMFPYMDT